MKKWIRWQGLIPFVLITGLLAVFFIFFIDSLIKWSVEEAGTSAVGAKVELGAARFDFSGPSLHFKSLRVTNPDKPMENIVDIDKIAFDLDGHSLLLRKFIIDEMTVDKVKINTPREKSGALKSSQPKTGKSDSKSSSGTGASGTAASGKEAESDFSMPAFATPDVDEILSREKLKTPELVDKFNADLDSTEQNWANLSEKLPAQDRLDSHKKRLDALKKTNVKSLSALAAGLKELKVLKADIGKDLKQYKDAKNNVSNDYKNIKQQLKELKNSPKEEYKRLLNKYTLDESGMGNISHLLFGDQAKEYTALALEWYKKIEPYLNNLKEDEEPEQERKKGINIRFREDNPVPDFLIKKVLVSVHISAGNFKGQILDITADQDITGKPTTLKFVGDKLANNMSIRLTGNFNHIDKKNPLDTLHYNMKNYRLNDQKLINDSSMQLAMKNALSDINIKANRKDKKINANGNMHIHAIKYSNSSSSGDAAKYLLAAIKQTRDFNIQGKLSGTLDNYSTSIKSDLDDRIKGNLKSVLNKEKEKYKRELKARIDEATQKPIKEAEQKLEKLKKSVDDDINARKAKLDQQLAALNKKVASYKNSSRKQQQQAKDKAKEKAKEKLKKLFSR